MPVTVKDGNYVVELPDYGLYQGINPDTHLPFADEAAALAWQAEYIANVAAAKAAHDAQIAAAQQAALAALTNLQIVADHTTAAIGTAISITATLHDGLGGGVAMDATFAVPIEDAAGFVAMIKSVTFAAGVASLSITFAHSGYYRITEQGLNRKLPPDQQIGLAAPFEVTIYE